jgi:hypothetical protein
MNSQDASFTETDTQASDRQALPSNVNQLIFEPVSLKKVQNSAISVIQIKLIENKITVTLKPALQDF